MGCPISRVPCEKWGGLLPSKLQRYPLCRASASANHPRRSLSVAMPDSKGLISRIGVPSSMSTPWTCRSRPLRRINSTMVSPIGFGLRGDLVANTPCARLSEGGVPSKANPWDRSNSQRTTRCENPSMSVSPASNSGKIASTPSASCVAPSPLGTSLASLYGLPTNPIGCGVNIEFPKLAGLPDIPLSVPPRRPASS
jgi:hypothetical protein